MTLTVMTGHLYDYARMSTREQSLDAQLDALRTAEYARIFTDLARGGIGFRGLAERIDTTSPAGKLIFGVFASLAAFERDRIAERTKEGLAAARARGRVGGRPGGHDLATASQGPGR